MLNAEVREVLSQIDFYPPSDEHGGVTDFSGVNLLQIEELLVNDYFMPTDTMLIVRIGSLPSKLTEWYSDIWMPLLIMNPLGIAVYIRDDAAWEQANKG